jgi:hypothetical protein
VAFDEFPLGGLLDDVETVIKNAKDKCAELLGSDALNKFKDLRKADKITFGKQPGFTVSNGARTIDDVITLNADSFAFDADTKLPAGGKNQTDYNKRVTNGFNEAYKNSGASSRREYAVGVIIHEFLRAIGVFPPDVTEDVFGNKDNSQSLKNQKEVIKKCLSDDK